MFCTMAELFTGLVDIQSHHNKSLRGVEGAHDWFYEQIADRKHMVHATTFINKLTNKAAIRKVGSCVDALGDVSELNNALVVEDEFAQAFGRGVYQAGLLEVWMASLHDVRLESHTRSGNCRFVSKACRELWKT